MNIEWLEGETCTRVYEHYVGNFTFEFPGASIAADCTWRIVREGRLALARSDQGQLFGRTEPVDLRREASSLLANRFVLGGRIDTELGDIVVEFEGNVRLEIFNDSSGYEAWRIGRVNGQTLVAASGGEVSVY